MHKIIVNYGRKCPFDKLKGVVLKYGFDVIKGSCDLTLDILLPDMDDPYSVCASYYNDKRKWEFSFGNLQGTKPLSNALAMEILESACNMLDNEAMLVTSAGEVYKLKPNSNR